MLPLLVRRLLATIPVMGVVALAVFGLLRLAPGDPASVIAGDYASPDDVVRIRSSLGLDQPLPKQLAIWFGNLLRGDLGTSIFSGLPVTTLIKQRVEPTVALATLTMLIAVTVAVPLGVLAAWKQGSWIDRSVMVFAVQLGWLPVQGYSPIAKGFWPFLRQLILPAMTLGFVYVALITRMTRASMLTVLREDYIRTAYAKGLPPAGVLMRHALKNASLPVVTIIGVGVALMVGGVVVTESVFALPGIGRLTVDAILRRDYPVIQAVILIVSGVYVLINLVIDLLYVVLDPRIRY